MVAAQLLSDKLHLVQVAGCVTAAGEAGYGAGQADGWNSNEQTQQHGWPVHE